MSNAQFRIMSFVVGGHARQGVLGGRATVLLMLILALLSATAMSAETNSASPLGRVEETNTVELRTYLQLQEQLHATQLAIERNRKEADETAAQTAKLLATRLQAVEQALSTQRAQELEAMQNSNRAMLIVAGCFAAMGFLAMLLMAYFQWRTVNRLAEISAALPAAGLGLGPGRPVPALGIGERQLVSVGAADSPGLLQIVARLEKRILELEHTSHPSLPHDHGHEPAARADASGAPANGETANGVSAAAGAGEPPTEAARITLLLGKGQSLLNLDKAEEAQACFDAVLALDSNHPEALVKKGAALERLRKLNEAIECYDRAIASDDSLTIAYLYKGGVFNRMERFTEALECYEQALRTQERRREGK